MSNFKCFSIFRSILTRLGASVMYGVRSLGNFSIFFFKSLLYVFPVSFRKIMQQLYFIGSKSLLVVSLIGAFTGMVLGLQGYRALAPIGMDGLNGSLVSLAIIWELGPVLTAIMIVARAGSAMTAEIGIMRTSDQIDALKTMDIQPIRFLVTPRVIAALVSFPLLTAVFDVIGIYGGYLTSSVLMGGNPGIYLSRMVSSIEVVDVMNSLVKALVFGALTVAICCYQGYYTHKRSGDFGAKGVSLSTTTAVVTSCVLVLISDYVLTTFLL